MRAGRVIIVSGPLGAGKTTVARELAARFEPSVHLENDQFFAAIRSGCIEPWLAASEAQNQVILQAAAGGYTVVVDGVVIPRNVRVYEERLAGLGMSPVYAVLLPNAETVLRRGMARADRELSESVYRQMHARFLTEAPAGSVIDTTRLSRSQSADAVLALAERVGIPVALTTGAR